MNEAWFDFIKLAKQTLAKGQVIDISYSNIQLLFEPSFSNEIFLQLAWKTKEVNWYRTTWGKLSDSPKFNDVMESLKYIGRKILPTITMETGTINISELNPILEAMRRASIKPRVEQRAGITIDGSRFTLTFGVVDLQTTYKWHTLPKEWKALEEVAYLILALNDKLKNN